VFQEVSSSGAFIATIGTTNQTTNLGLTEVEYILAYNDPNVYTLASSSSRVQVLVQLVQNVTVTGTLEIFAGGEADTHLQLPASSTQYTINGTPFCTGFTPTNGQFLQYTTASSPNPCYTAAAASSTTGNAASVVTYTPGASVTLTCPSSTAGTVVTFDPSGTALAANMALSFASCTTGQIVMVRIIQAASGGPYTVSGLPTGSPQISTYPSAGTIYTLQASGATTMNFVNVAANAGSSTLGSGAQGISRTVTAGSSGVTANLLADKDTSNPTVYNTAAIGSCGLGVAAYSATSTNLFELYSVPGTVLTMVADGSITAGHLLTAGASTAGRVADTGQTAQTSVPIGTCIVGVALASQTVGNTVLVAYYGSGTYGALAASSTTPIPACAATPPAAGAAHSTCYDTSGNIWQCSNGSSACTTAGSQWVTSGWIFNPTLNTITAVSGTPVTVSNLRVPANGIVGYSNKIGLLFNATAVYMQDAAGGQSIEWDGFGNPILTGTTLANIPATAGVGPQWCTNCTATGSLSSACSTGGSGAWVFVNVAGTKLCPF
jgi:hypothetical protein